METVIPEGSSEVYAPQVDYKKAPINKANYLPFRLLPLSGGQTSTMTSAGGGSIQFEIPKNAYNLSKTELIFTATPAAGASYNWAWVDCLSFFRQIRLSTRGSVDIVRIDDVNNYTKLVWPCELELQKFLNFDLFTGGSGLARMIRRTNALASAVGSIRHDATAGEINYTEQKYLDLGGSTTTTPVFNVVFNLGLLVQTLFALDKDSFFNETVILEFVTAPTSKVLFVKNSATDPSSGTIYTGNITLSNLQLRVFQEMNPVVIRSLQASVDAGGLEILMPWVFGYKISLSGTSQAPTLRLNRNNGQRLLKMYSAPFNSTESGNTGYDHTNISAAKVTSYQTFLNNNAQQSYLLSCANGDDYALVMDKLEGKLIQSSNIFNYNFVIMEDFSSDSSNSNIIDGLSLDVEQIYSIQATTANSTFIWYMYAVLQRSLIIDKNGIKLI